MLDVNLIRQNSEKVKEGVMAKGFDVGLVEEFLRIDDEWRKTVGKIDEMRGEQNALSKKFAVSRSEDEVSRARDLRGDVSKLDLKEKELDKKRSEILGAIPNLPFSNVPIGKNEKENVELRIIISFP